MNDTELPLISIIIATLNCVHTLQQCLDSVARQTYSPLELIVIDGGSTDGTIDILHINARKISYWESEKIAVSTMRGIKAYLTHMASGCIFLAPMIDYGMTMC